MTCCKRSVFALHRPRPKPGQNHVDRQVRHPRVAQQRLWFRQSRRTKCPVPGPEFVALHFEDFTQANRATPCPANPWRTTVPVFESRRRPPASARRAPAGVEDGWPGAGREISRPRAAKCNHRIHRVRATSSPKSAANSHRHRSGAGQFERQQTADAEQPRLQAKHRIRAARPTSRDSARFCIGHALCL